MSGIVLAFFGGAGALVVVSDGAFSGAGRAFSVRRGRSG